MKIGDHVKTKPGVVTIGGWSGSGTILSVRHEKTQPGNPVVAIRRDGKSADDRAYFEGNQLETVGQRVTDNGN